jgi:hypothetical protein
VASPFSIQRAGDTVWCTLDRPPLNLFEPTIHAVRESRDHARRRPLDARGDPRRERRAFTAGMDVRVLRDPPSAGRAR